MKKYKLLLCGLIITGFLSSELVNAASTSKNYVGIQLKISKIYSMIEQISRSNDLGQEYYNAGNINQCTANENGVTARLDTSTLTASELDIPTGNTRKTFKGDYVTAANKYTLYLKNYTWSACKSSHSGSWYHN